MALRYAQERMVDRVYTLLYCLTPEKIFQSQRAMGRRCVSWDKGTEHLSDFACSARSLLQRCPDFEQVCSGLPETKQLASWFHSSLRDGLTCRSVFRGRACF
jgi:hypothetical protein